MDTVVKAKEWGNSLGIVLPSELVKRKGIKPGEEVIINIEKKQNVLKELFGALKFKQPVDRFLKTFRKEMESKWLR